MWAKLYKHYKNKGIVHLLKLIAQRSYKNLVALPLYIAALPFALLMVILFPWVEIYLVKLISSRIGHYSMNIELLLCAMAQPEHQNCKKEWVLFYQHSGAGVCNKQLKLMWQRILPFLPFPKIAMKADKIVALMLRSTCYHQRYEFFKQYEVSSGNVDNQGLLSAHKPRLTFNAEELRLAKKMLKRLGIAKAAFVCLLVRDSAYLDRMNPDNDWSYHNCRDADVANYRDAALWLAEKGYYVLRMGKYTDKKFSVPHPRVIDYANHSLKSDFLDIYLAAHCRYFISTSSGLDGVAQIFRRPVLYTDVFPNIANIQFWYPAVLLQTKVIFDHQQNRYLTAFEVDKLFLNNRDTVRMLSNGRLELRNNTSAQILAAAKEMEARLTALEDNSPLQSQEQQLFIEQLRQRFLKHHGNKYQVAKVRIAMVNSFLTAYKDIYT
jgi:putative glycosyltransferase (TIGR04372 family)